MLTFADESPLPDSSLRFEEILIVYIYMLKAAVR